MKWMRRSAAGLAVALVAATPAAAAGPAAVVLPLVVVTVADSSGVALEGANVTLELDGSDSDGWTGTTDVGGSLILDGLDVGIYHLVVLDDGATHGSATTDLVVTGDSANGCGAAVGATGTTVEAACSGPLVAVERFWSQRFNNAHFYTTSQAEAAYIDANDTNWQYENSAFIGWGALMGECSVGDPVHRFWSPGFSSHFYTISEAEKVHVVANDRNWRYEGVAYCALTADQREDGDGSVPLYRFWSPGFGKHFFTANQAEADHIVANDRNWNPEGIAYYVLPVDSASWIG